MILIGISGKSGAGKTSASNVLAKELECNVYHLDDLQKEVEKWKKNSYLKKFTVASKDSNGDEKIFVNPKLKGQTLNNKQVDDMYEKIKTLALKEFIKRKINKENRKGAMYFIIEGTQLSTYLNLKNTQIKILIKRPYNLRRRDIMLRDGITKKEFEQREKYDNPKIARCNDFDYVIKNNETRINNLYEEMKQIATNTKKIGTWEMTR